MSDVQLWQAMQLEKTNDMVGNTEALAELQTISSGFILISGPYGCGKTSLALAYAHERTGIEIGHEQTEHRMGRAYVVHIHAANLEMNAVTTRRIFFGLDETTIIIVDEAQELTYARQQSRLKTLPVRPELTVIFCTTNPEKLDKAILDRCQKIRLGPLSAREVPALVERACKAKGIPHNQELVRALNQSGVLRPRAILNAVDAVARGRSIDFAVTEQKV